MNKGIMRILLIITAMCLLSASLVGATALPEESQLDTSQSESSQPDTSEPDSSQPESSQPESSQPESSQPESSQPETPKVSGVSISFSLPRGWYTKTARVGVVVSDLYDVGIKKVEAKAVQNGSWTDISDTLYAEISDNGTIYVQVTVSTGEVVAKSVYVECFDRVKPTVRASRSGRLLRIEASDDLSGVAAIFVDGEEFTDLMDGTLEYRLNTRNTKEDKIWIQAKDCAGNVSATVTITNPYYVDPDKKEATQQQEKEPEKKQENSTVQQPPSEVAATTTPPASETATTTVVPAASSGATASEAESAAAEESKGIPGVITVGNKQFITIETRDEKIFYLIIDGDLDSDNVYLVTEVTTQDLLSFTADEAVPADSDSSAAAVPDTDSLIDGGELPVKDNRDDDAIPIGDAEPSGEDGESSACEQPPDGEPAEDGKKASPIPGWIVIAALALTAALAGYMFLIVLPRKKAKEAFADIDDDDDLEEEYADEPAQPVPPDEDENPLDIPFENDED